MITEIQVNGLQLAVKAESVEYIPQGALLRGEQVTLLHPFGEAPFYRHGWHSWSLSCWLPLSGALEAPLARSLWPQIDHPSLLADYPFTSSGVSALQGPDGRILLLGALGLDAQVKAASETMTGSYATPAPDEPVWFLGYEVESIVFSDYANFLGQRLGARDRLRPSSVWCSWYSLYREITEEALLGILPSLSDFPFEVFQVDDGWQASLGDWEPNEKFPSGMAALAGKIHHAGYTPGLWLAPFTVGPKSHLHEEHPEWLLRDERGEPVIAGHNWGDEFYGLDLTRPGVQKWLAELIQQVRLWGYEYLKLDFLYTAALPGVRYQNLSGEMALRKGLEIIRQAAGEEAYILTCGVPMLATLGLADGVRIGPDVAPFWDNVDRSQVLHDLSGPSSLNAIRTSLHRLWLRPLIQLDPDVAFFRSKFNLLQPEQKGLLQDLGLITGFRATSDLPAWLQPDERRALLSFLQADPRLSQFDRYRFLMDDRQIDFSQLQGLIPA